MAESKEELKNLLTKVKEESEKVGLKLNIQKTKIMASGPISSWQIDEETMEIETLFWGLQNHLQTVTAVLKLKIKRHLFFGRKAMTNLDSILKSRDITLPTKVHLVKAMVFSISHLWMWELLSTKDLDALELCCWKRLLRGPWTARRSNQSILKEISPEYSLKGLMAEAETPILWPVDAKNWPIGKDPDAGKDWRQEEKGTTEDEMVGQHHQLNGHKF